MNSARELLQFDFDAGAFARRAPQPIPIPAELVNELEIIVREHDGTSDIPETEDLRQIYHLFFNAVRTGRLHTQFDSPTRIRRLAWALTFSEDGLPQIVDTPGLDDALQLIADRFRMSTVLGVFDALLQAWDAPSAKLLRDFVRRHLAMYDGRRQSVQNIRANLAWYCEENGATRLAINLLRTEVNLSTVWSCLNLRDRTHGFRYFGVVAEAYVELNQRLDRESVADIVAFVEMHRDDRTNRAVVSKIIEGLGVDASEDLRQPVQSYVFREWQDPRLAGGDARWQGVSDEARQIFTRWITKEDLRFFFDTVAKECNDPKFAYRKAFWLAYLEKISFCRPILGRKIHLLLRNNPEASQYYRERRPATLTGGNSSQHAFIIQMGDHTFVEFSTAGACYVYEDVARPFSLHDPQYSMAELRWKGRETHWQPHPGSERYLWQRNFALWLKSNLGINQLRSYRLGKPENNETNDIVKLIRGLDNKRIWSKNARGLVKIGKPAVPALIEALRAQDHRIRNRAIYTLGQLGKSAVPAIPTLRELRLRDPNDFIRSQAESALKKIEPISQY